MSESEKLAEKPADDANQETPAPPVWPYVVPMVLFLLLTTAEGSFARPLYPWVYMAKAALVTASLFVCAPYWKRELSPTWKPFPLAVFVGLLVFAEWVLVEKYVPYPGLPLGARTAYNPFAEIENSGLRNLFLSVRFFGLAVMVPIMEEVFWRSFGLRYTTDLLGGQAWHKLAVGVFSWPALFAVSAVFALAHPEWLPAFLCALLYGLLLKATRSLPAAVLAHAVTNGALGVYVLLSGEWKLW